MKSRILLEWRNDKVAQAWREWYWDTYTDVTDINPRRHSGHVWVTIGLAALGLGIVCSLACIMFSQSIR